MANQTSLITALKNCADLEKDGRVIVFGSGASVDTVRGLVAEKLDIVGGLANDITLWDEHDCQLTTIDEIRKQRVVYAGLRTEIHPTIPGPANLPFVGALHLVLPDIVQGWRNMFDRYGPVVDMTILNKRMIGTNDPAVAEYFAKESEYFTKKIAPTLGLSELKAVGGQGLFTTDTYDDDWQLAHKLLMPAFSPRAIKAYANEMATVTKKTIALLEQYTPGDAVCVLDYMTKLTFETIGHCGFNYDFGLLDKRDAPPHPFTEAMGYCLALALTRAQRPQFMKYMPTEQNRKFHEGNKLMYDTVLKVIQDRKKGPDANNANMDLLGYMLNARDENNLGLSDDNIIYQVLTFLIAGHETTANTLSWIFYELTRAPHIEAKILQEIVDVGITHDTIPTVEQISAMKYTLQVIKETLRMYPAVRIMSRYCIKDCIIPGGYKIPANTVVGIHTLAMQMNPKVFPNPEVFDPDRWTPEEEQKRSRYSWLPFSTGPRACIGMAFAIQETKIAIAMLLHRFKFCYDGPPVKYDPQAATTKPPRDFVMIIRDRADLPKPGQQAQLLTPPLSPVKSAAAVPQPTLQVNRQGLNLPAVTVLFGTQTGTAQDYASQLASQARAFGFSKVTLCDMDKWERLSGGGADDKAHLLVVCTATYNGQPPDNAEKFAKFIEQSTATLNNYKYAVFGLGNRNWRTYQAFPRKIDSALEAMGAERFFAAGQGDADKDIDAQFNDWSAHFWSHTLLHFGLSVPDTKSVVPSANTANLADNISVQFIHSREKDKWAAAQNNYHGDYTAKVLVNRELQSPTSGRSTRHVEIELTDAKYEPGDHIEIMPENDPRLVELIAIQFGWVLDAVFEVNGELESLSPRSLAASIHGPCTVRNMLTYYADLTSPPSRTMLAFFAHQLRTTASETAAAFERLVMPDAQHQDGYPAFIQQYRTLADLVAAFPGVNKLDLAQFLTAVNVMQPRRYSIACSPNTFPNQAHIAVSVVQDMQNGRCYPGLASSYLARQPTQLRAVIHSSKATFQMPADAKTPLLMIGAGTGISPFRGFLQERAWQKEHDQPIGGSIVVYGCRRPDQDALYADELATFVNTGVISRLFMAYSRQEPASPIRYVQHQLLANASLIWRWVMEEGAHVYVCGGTGMSNGVQEVFCNMAKSFGEAATDEEAEAFVQSLIHQKRYQLDVWG